MDARPLTAEEQIEIVKRDLIGKFARGDDHGVMDCAADLRELKAYQRGYQDGLKAAVNV